MWLFTRQEAKNADLLTQRSGISEEILMERAGQASAHEIEKELQRKKKDSSPSAVLICGSGHNGGDGFVVASTLLQKGWKIQVVCFSSDSSSELWKKKKSEFSGTIFSPEQFLSSDLQADIWIDGLFGIGLNRPLPKLEQQVLNAINQKQGFKVALDVPSGLDCDTGNIFDTCFKADLTLTVERPKVGFYFNLGPEMCGRIQRIQIGFSKETIRASAQRAYLLSAPLAARWIPVRSATDHKAKGGKTLIWAGSKKMPGAAILASHAAGRVGAGYIYVTEPQVLSALPEAIPFQPEALNEISSVLLGPGLGVNDQTGQALKTLRGIKQPVVVDADALSEAALHPEDVLPFPAHWVATPHSGELSRLLKLSSKQLESNRLEAAEKAQKALGCTVVMKGFHTVIALPKFSVIVPTGNVALAKGGSGDVLAGIIVGLLSQQVSPERAALLGAYIHGEIADRWVASGRDYLSLTPTDLLQQIPQTLTRLRRKVRPT
jgi:hydroxyethylthiazole kinase-like uncharacterized protein yjeF